MTVLEILYFLPKIKGLGQENCCNMQALGVYFR